MCAWVCVCVSLLHSSDTFPGRDKHQTFVRCFCGHLLTVALHKLATGFAPQLEEAGCKKQIPKGPWLAFTSGLPFCSGVGASV